MASNFSTPPAEITSPTTPALIVYADDLHAFKYDDVAERLGVSLDTVQRLVKRGELRELRVGRTVRIAAPELRRYLSGGAA